MTSLPYEETFEIEATPDPADTNYLGIAGGDVKSAIWAAFEQLVRVLVNMPAASAGLGIIYRYDPTKARKERQSRLSAYLHLSARNEATLQSLKSLVMGGMIRRFYPLEAKKGPIFDACDFRCVCYIERRQDFVEPLYTNDFNPYIPEQYYTVMCFEPNPDNDYLLLDKILDRVEEPVVIALSISPADVSGLLNAHTAYLAQLNSINRSWQHEDSDCDILEDVDWSDRRDGSVAGKLKALNYKDPLADDILRRQRRFHETLLEPHLRFEFKVMSQTESVVRLVASTICMSAFADGKYQLRVEELDDDHSAEKI